MAYENNGDQCYHSQHKFRVNMNSVLLFLLFVFIKRKRAAFQHPMKKLACIIVGKADGNRKL